MRGILAPSTTNESIRGKDTRTQIGSSGDGANTTEVPVAHQSVQEVTELFWDMAHWLGRKYKATYQQSCERIRKGNTFGTRTITLVHANRRTRPRGLWQRPGTTPTPEREAIERERRIKRESFSYDNSGRGNEDRQGWMDLREEVISSRDTTCYMCGKRTLHPSEVEIDHIIPRATVQRPNGG